MNKFHDVGLKVLGDAVLNHRCAHYQNQNGVWNIFGGRLNWDDRAVVADDPHFQVYSCSVLQTFGNICFMNYQPSFFFRLCFIIYLFCLQKISISCP